jgi:cystathionine gamma-lyase
MTRNNRLGFATRAIHAGQQPDPVTGAIMTPIYASSTYVQQSPGVHKGYEYSRSHNPTRKALEDCVAYLSNAVGAILGPNDSFWVLRALKTLPLRMRQHCESAAQIARFLESHPDIDKVYYPGLESHPQHDIARRQMNGFGGIVTAVVKGGLEPALRFLERCELFSLAESLGGVESLIEHPAIMTHASIPADIRASIGIDDGLVRLSVGVEDIDVLIGDLEQALN